MYSRNCCLPGGPAKPVSGLVDILVASRINIAACNMVTVITEKLQNQSLDDVKFAEIVSLPICKTSVKLLKLHVTNFLKNFNFF